MAKFAIRALALAALACLVFDVSIPYNTVSLCYVFKCEHRLDKPGAHTFAAIPKNCPVFRRDSKIFSNVRPSSPLQSRFFTGRLLRTHTHTHTDGGGLVRLGRRGVHPCHINKTCMLKLLVKHHSFTIRIYINNVTGFQIWRVLYTKYNGQSINVGLENSINCWSSRAANTMGRFKSLFTKEHRKRSFHG